jgi:hypothetical protein
MTASPPAPLPHISTALILPKDKPCISNQANNHWVISSDEDRQNQFRMQTTNGPNQVMEIVGTNTAGDMSEIIPNGTQFVVYTALQCTPKIHASQLIISEI